MMAASEQTFPRRKRYERQAHAAAPLTLRKRRCLEYVASYGILSVPQLALLLDTSPKELRKQMRPLYDMGLVSVIPVSRTALAEPEEGNTAALLFGSAPNLYILTTAGAKVLMHLGVLEAMPALPAYGPRNSLFLAHELAVKDVRIWLERTARHSEGHRLEQWKEGGGAVFPLAPAPSKKVVRPDAWFVYRMDSNILVGLVEVDRGTERGTRRWQEKLTAYTTLFQRGRVKELTGYHKARVLVTVPNERRRLTLAAFLAEQGQKSVAELFWLTTAQNLNTLGFTASVWQQPGSALLKPLIPALSAGGTVP